MNELSFLDLITKASVMVQLVMLLLVLASIMSWAVILKKRRILNQSRRSADAFEKKFWSGGDLSSIYQKIADSSRDALGMESIFEGGFREFSRLRAQPDVDRAQLIDGSQRAMRVSQMREVDRLEEHLAMLATIGSTSPYVGLFGTVWGIMNAFTSLGNVQHATLAMVAPGIAEALVATAMGLFAAIPAVIAYNRYADQVTRLENRYDTFKEEFVAILQRHAPRSGSPGTARARS